MGPCPSASTLPLTQVHVDLATRIVMNKVNQPVTTLNSLVTLSGMYVMLTAVGSVCVASIFHCRPLIVDVE